MGSRALLGATRLWEHSLVEMTRGFLSTSPSHPQNIHFLQTNPTKPNQTNQTKQPTNTKPNQKPTSFNRPHHPIHKTFTSYQPIHQTMFFHNSVNVKAGSITSTRVHCSDSFLVMIYNHTVWWRDNPDDIKIKLDQKQEPKEQKWFL